MAEKEKDEAPIRPTGQSPDMVKVAGRWVPKGSKKHAPSKEDVAAFEKRCKDSGYDPKQYPKPAKG